MAEQKDIFFSVKIDGKDTVKTIGQMTGELQNSKNQLTKLNKEFKTGKIGQEAYGKAATKLRTNIKSLSGNLREAENKMSGLTKQGLRFRDKMAGGLTKSIKEVGLQLGKAFAVGAIVAGLTKMVDIFKDFAAANSTLTAILGGTEEQMKALSDQAKALGASTAFTASQVVELQTEFAKLGFTAEQIGDVTEATLNLAAASGTDLATAAATAGGTLNAFGLAATETGHLTDVMAASFTKSGLDMTKFSETMKSAAPIAKAAGVSLEVATAAAGKLADANISGSVAGTGLKKIFAELVKDGKPLEESLDDIAQEMEGASSNAEKLAIAEGRVGNIAKGSLLVLVEQRKELGALAGELENADGSAQAMADTMLDNLAGDITKAGSAWEGFVLSLEDGEGVISDVLRGVTQGTSELLARLTDLNSLGFSGTIAKNTKEGLEEQFGITDKIVKLRKAAADGDEEAAKRLETLVLGLRGKVEGLIGEGELTAAQALSDLVKEAGAVGIGGEPVEGGAAVEGEGETGGGGGAVSPKVEAAQTEAQMLAEIKAIEDQLALDALLATKEKEQAILDAQLEHNRERDENDLGDRVAANEAEKETNQDRIDQLAKDQEAEANIRLARVASAHSALGSIARIAGEETKIGKAALAAQKAVALTHIGINLGKELSAIGTNAAANPLNIPTAGIAGVTQTAILSALAIGKAAVNTGLVLAAAGGADFVTTGPQMMMVGDNPGGRERVTVEPLSGAGTTRMLNGVPHLAGGGSVTTGVGQSFVSDNGQSQMADQILEGMSNMNIGLNIHELNAAQADLSNAVEMSEV
jgi:hypothetical protein